MDDLPDFSEYRTCLRDLDRVTALVLSHRPTLRFLDAVAARYPGKPLRILDVACSDGAMLRRIARWSARRSIPVHLTGLDLNPRAIRIARAFPPTTPPIDYIASDVFAYTPEQPPDLILSAHFTHHLPDEAILRFLRWMESTATVGWFVNDLHRHPNPYRLFRLLGLVLPIHPVVLADGLLSIRRAFTPQDWRDLLLQAATPHATVTEAFPARITVSRLR